MLNVYHRNQGINVLIDGTELLSQELVNDATIDTEQRMRWMEQRVQELEKRSRP